MKKTLVINPFKYKDDELDAVRIFAEDLKDHFDTYVILGGGAAGKHSAEGVSFVEEGTRKHGYLEVTADCVIDGGAVSGSSRLSVSQKRFCVENRKLNEELPEEAGKSGIIKATDYYSCFDAKVSGSDAGKLIESLREEAAERRYSEVIFLMEYLEQDDGIHRAVTDYAKLFKNAFGTKVYAIGLKEIGVHDINTPFFDSGNVFDLKLSTENNPGTVRNILIETDGIVIICDKQARHGYRNYLSGNRLVYMYKGGSRQTGNNRMFRGRDYADPRKWAEAFDFLCESGGEAGISVERAESIVTKAINRAKKDIAGKSGNAQAKDTDLPVRTNSSDAAEPLVSVVIPFYNDSSTIGNAIGSIRSNGYGNYEIILVNDGSPEDPMPLLGEDDRIRYFYKENGGPGSARNKGVDEAEGKYLLFLDSDDISLPGAISELVRFAEQSGADMVCGKTIRRYKETGREEDWCGGSYTREKTLSMSERGNLIDDTICHGKLYRLDSLKKAGLRFGDGLYEDNAFMGKVYSSLDRIGIIPYPVQKWLIYGHNTSRSTENTLKNAKARLKVVDDIYDNADDRLKVYYTRQYIRHQIIVCLNGYRNYSHEEKQELFGLMKSGMAMRRNTILDRLILMPSKKEFYKSILNDDFERFDRIAMGFSELYFEALDQN